MTRAVGTSSVRLARHRRGFTLLELVLVLAILAATLGGVTFSMAGFTRGRQPEDAAAQFVAVARWARSQAISDGEIYYIVIDPAQRGWRVMVDDGGTMVEAEGEFAREYTVSETVRIETDAPMLDDRPTITFDPTGRGDPAEVRFIGPSSEVRAVCSTPIDEFHVVKGGGQ